MKMLHVMLIIGIIFTNIFSQETNNEMLTYKSGWASIMAGFKVGSLEGGFGGMLGGKYHFSKNSALRFGFEGSKINSYKDADAEYSRNPGDELVKANQYGVFADYLYYIETKKHVKLYIGGGPTAGKYIREYSHYNPENWPVPEDDYKSNYDQWYMGVDGKIGLEWLATTNFGISLDYALSYKYFDGDYDSYYVVENREFTDQGLESDYNTITKNGKKSSSNFYSNQFLLGFNVYL